MQSHLRLHARALCLRSSGRSPRARSNVAAHASSSLGPPERGSSAGECVATVAVAPAPDPAPSRFQEIGRAAWPGFAALELLALIGATYNGITSRRRRVQIEALNEQLVRLRERERERTAHEEHDVEEEYYVMYERALELEGQSDYAAAIETLERAVELASGADGSFRADAYALLGDWSTATGKYEDAAKFYDRSLSVADVL
mmetsp:Transcript_6878/g.22843  ORF Transcript_6878/g.22843 Transcript_6878/m.22843 type:complete len:202 (+) Transcript_6878:187-792(+)